CWPACGPHSPLCHANPPDNLCGEGGAMARTAPVDDWASDFDILDPGYIADPFRIWDELRRTCPIAHTDRRGSNWLPTRYADVTAIAHDVAHFSSLEVAVIPFEGEEPEERLLPYGLPPISA